VRLKIVAPRANHATAAHAKMKVMAAILLLRLMGVPFMVGSVGSINNFIQQSYTQNRPLSTSSPPVRTPDLSDSEACD
jgi:hypothetical protein